MLTIMFNSSMWAWDRKRYPVPLRSTDKTRGKRGPKVQYDCDKDSSYNHALLHRLAMSQIVLGLLALVAYHVQIITRLSSGYPVWYWWLASLSFSGKRVEFLGWQWDLARLMVRWMVVYALIQGGLFASFLPPA